MGGENEAGEALAELGDGLCEGCFVNLPKNIVVRIVQASRFMVFRERAGLFYAGWVLIKLK